MGKTFSRKHAAAGVALSGVLAIALCAGVAAMPHQAQAAKQVDGAELSGTWNTGKSYVTYKYSTGAKAKGLTKIDGKTYYFDSKGRQRTGWQRIDGVYRFFKIANGAKGYMVKSKTVNGIKLHKSGAAYQGSAATAELKIMVKANKVHQKVTKPTQSKSTRLKKVWSWLINDCGERGTRTFHATSGWHRTFANDIFNAGSGSCESYGAAFAYLANAVGYKNCYAICSGGHAWAEVNGKVYDPEWSKGRIWAYYAFDYANSGHNGAPDYKNNKLYVVKISPKKSLWYKNGKIPSAAKKKNGLYKSGSNYYYYSNGKKVTNKWVTLNGNKYYFKSNGKAAKKSTKIGSVYYVFDTNGVLQVGKKTRRVTVANVIYRVYKSGKAKPSASLTDGKLYYMENGALATDVRFMGKKLTWFSAKGKYNAAKTKALRKAAKIGSDPTALLDMLGTPKKTKRINNSCWGYGRGANGADLVGVDINYTYPQIVVSVFECEDGTLYLENVAAK